MKKTRAETRSLAFVSIAFATGASLMIAACGLPIPPDEAVPADAKPRDRYFSAVDHLVLRGAVAYSALVPAQKAERILDKDAILVPLESVAFEGMPDELSFLRFDFGGEELLVASTHVIKLERATRLAIFVEARSAPLFDDAAMSPEFSRPLPEGSFLPIAYEGRSAAGEPFAIVAEADTYCFVPLDDKARVVVTKPEGTIARAIVDAPFKNIPEKDAPVIGELPAGTTMKLLGIVDTGALVDAGNGPAWVDERKLFVQAFGLGTKAFGSVLVDRRPDPDGPEEYLFDHNKFALYDTESGKVMAVIEPANGNDVLKGISRVDLPSGEAFLRLSWHSNHFTTYPVGRVLHEFYRIREDGRLGGLALHFYSEVYSGNRHFDFNAHVTAEIWDGARLTVSWRCTVLGPDESAWFDFVAGYAWDREAEAFKVETRTKGSLRVGIGGGEYYEREYLALLDEMTGPRPFL